MSQVKAIELRKHYRQGRNLVRAVDGVSLSVEAGELVAVVGRSGSGKTTLLDMLGLLLRPTSGTVLVDGADTTRLGERGRTGLRGRRIGFIFQEHNLLPTLNVMDNMLLPLRYTGANRRQGRDRARELLDEVGMGNRLRHHPSELSGGEEQRVAVARALVNQPALVLADEPTGSLDTETSAQLMALIRRMNRDEAVTFVIVTHDQELARQAGRTFRLRDGRVA
jgi:putative ABC transport system ATP-binding protein